MDKYANAKALSSGNYGTFYRIQCRSSGLHYGLKVISLKDKTEAQRNDTLKEARALGAIHHPNVTRYRESIVDGDKLYIVMEYGDAMDLDKYLVGRLRANEVVQEGMLMRIFVQIALGLRAIHRARLLHRDLKSANVFLTTRGGVLLGDFGFARQLGRTLSVAHTVCGTPYYFSPELCAKKPYVQKVDMWSLGVILYEMINLKKPFEAQDLAGLRRRVLNEEPAPSTVTHVTPEVQSIVAALLRKNEHERPSIDQLLAAPEVRRWLLAFQSVTEQEIDLAKKEANDIVRESRGATAEPAPFVRPPIVNHCEPGGTRGSKGTMSYHHISQHVGSEPHARDHLGAEAPLEIVGRLQTLLARVDSLERLLKDTMDVLAMPEGPSISVPPVGPAHNAASQSAPPSHHAAPTAATAADGGFEGAVGVDGEGIGDAQTEEERFLMGLLGDAFARAVQLVLLLDQSAEGSPEAVAYNSELAAILGANASCLAELQQVAANFELDLPDQQ